MGRGTLLHAELQRAVHSADGQGFIQFPEHIGARVGIPQERDQKLRRDVVVIGKAATVSQVIPVGVMPQLLHQHADGGKSVFGRNMLLSAALHAQPAQHGFGIEVVALLHYLLHHILHGSFIRGHPHGKAVLPELAEEIGRSNGRAPFRFEGSGFRNFVRYFRRRNAPDSPCLQPFHKGVHEEVLRRKDIDRTCAAGVDVARYGDVVPVHQPVARHTEAPGRGCTASGLVRQCIIGRGGSALKACAVAPLAGEGGDRHHPFVQHQR